MDAIFARIHVMLVGMSAHSQSDIVRAMPYLLEAAVWSWVAVTFWLGIRVQLRGIGVNTPEQPTQKPGTLGFEPPTQQLPDGSMVRAEANADWTIRAWVPWTPPQPHVGPRS
jgi:hypothetical protein